MELCLDADTIGDRFIHTPKRPSLITSSLLLFFDRRFYPYQRLLP